MSHKSYQPAVPCGNKLLQKKWDDAYYEEHRRRLRKAKSMVDTKPPAPHPHVVHKQKKQQLEAERAEMIQRDNMTLLHKMQNIVKGSGKGIDHKNTYQHHSLNDLKRQRENERVAKENEAMLERLQKVKPMYRVEDWVKHWQKNAELTEMITAYPEAGSPRQQIDLQPPVPNSTRVNSIPMTVQLEEASTKDKVSVNKDSETTDSGNEADSERSVSKDSESKNLEDSSATAS